jgi:hypothetical protein
MLELFPIEFIANTVNVYVVEAFKPVIVIDLSFGPAKFGLLLSGTQMIL